MAKTFTVQDFFKRFPTDEACLNHLMLTRYGEKLDCPKCGKHGKFHRVRRHPAYECAWCGYEIYPMVGTPFQRSRTSLQKWFYAMYLFTTSRNGVAAKELQRQLGVTYKCAWRMAHEIRKYMGKVDGDNGLSGHVEVDETVIGGRRKGPRGGAALGKTMVFGMLERGGDVMTKIVPNSKRVTLQPVITENVEKGSEIHSDELATYKTLPDHGYGHNTVKHRFGEYVNGIAHVNSLEGFWSQLKRSINGTHIHVSKKHLASYLAEFEYRFNMRHHPEWMFDRLLMSF